MAVFKFSTTARLEHDHALQAGHAVLHRQHLQTYLNNYDPDGYTNWDDGLLAGAAATTATSRISSSSSPTATRTATGTAA